MIGAPFGHVLFVFAIIREYMRIVYHSLKRVDLKPKGSVGESDELPFNET
jgi:hypothetical protein